MAKKTSKITSFEKALSELEEIVDNMENGELSLEEAIKHFERGMDLTQSCQSLLNDAEQKVQMLVEKKGKTKLEAFSEDEPSAED